MKHSPYLMQLQSFTHTVCTGQEGKRWTSDKSKKFAGFYLDSNYEATNLFGILGFNWGSWFFPKWIFVEFTPFLPTLVAQTLSGVKPAANAEATYGKDKSLVGEAASAKQPVKACQQLSEKITASPGRGFSNKHKWGVTHQTTRRALNAPWKNLWELFILHPRAEGELCHDWTAALSKVSTLYSAAAALGKK